MAEAIKDEFGVAAKMIEGKGGIFDVTVDGKRIWCKHEVGRFPEHNEVLDQVASIAGKGGQRKT